MCDNPKCRGAKMLPKEGDESGIAPIKKRLEKDEKLMERADSLYGIPKIFLRNSLPLKSVKKYVDDYEITPEYHFKWDKKNEKVETGERPWVVKDDEGIESVSLLAQPVAVSLIKQMAKVLGL